MVNNRIINGTAHVYIDDEIGSNGVRGGDIAREIMDFKAQGLHVVVNINSVGGSVFDAYQIIDAIVQSNADTHISGMAASAAGTIALFGHNRTANDFAVVMIHAVKGSNKELIEMVDKRLKKILNDKTQLKEEQIESMLSDGKDHFFDAEEAFNLGILTSEPINTGKNKPVEFDMLNFSEKYEIINSLNLEMNMKQVFNKLDLSLNATETEVLNKIEGLENEASEAMEMAKKAEEEKNEVVNKLEELQKQVDEGKKAVAENLIENAIKEGKIGESEKEDWKELAVENFAKAEKLIGAISAVSPRDFPENHFEGKEGQKEDLLKNGKETELKNFMRSEAAATLKADNEELYNKYQEKYLTL